MSFLQHIKRSNVSSAVRWFLKYNDEGFIREIKQVYKASEYRKLPNARPLLTKNKLIEALEADKIIRTNKNKSNGKLD